MGDIYQDIEDQIPRLRRYARSLVRDTTVVDDLVQECLARALAKLHLWQEGTNLRAWLFTILHNQYINHLRRQIRSGTTVELSETELPSRAAGQDQYLELRDLRRALDQLPEAQRAAILLIGLEGMRYEEAAGVLGIPVGTVRSRISRGRSTLHRLMSGELDHHAQRAAAAIVAAKARGRHHHVGSDRRSAPLAKVDQVVSEPAASAPIF
jgi:RNA polymerase sigma-70 factor, ECF subfamily